MPSAYLAGFDSGFFAHCLTTRDALPERLLNVQMFGDVRNITVDDLKGFDAVVQLAAVSNDPMGNRFEAVTDAINHRAAVDTASKAADAGVKAFVFASSCSVYGLAGDGQARSERDAVNPLTAYARSKIAAEEALHQSTFGEMSITCLRFATACGMSERLRLDLVLNDFVACAVAAGEITVLSDGTPWRPLIDVRDMSRAIEWAIGRETNEETRYLSLNVGSEEWNYQVRDLAQAVARGVSGTTVSINTNAQPDGRSYKVDFGLFKRLAPDHQPLETLASSIDRLRDGLAEVSFNDRDFRQSQLIRLKVLEKQMSSGVLSEDLRLVSQS